MPLIIECHDPTVRGIKDPYTGKELEFYLSLTGGLAPKMFAKNAYSISTRYPTSQEALRKATSRQGVEGAVNLGADLVCPYLGTPLRLTGDAETGYYLVGGFDPTIPIFDAPTFLERVTSVGGVSTHPKRTIPYAKVVNRDESEAPEIAAPEAQDITQDSLDVIKSLVDGPAKTKKTSVAVNGRKKKAAP